MENLAAFIAPSLGLFQTFVQTSELEPCPHGPSVRSHNCFCVRASTEGCVYAGDWKNGQGLLTADNDSKDVGQFRLRLPHGQGTVTYPGGSGYIGVWRDGKSHDRQGTFVGTYRKKYIDDYGLVETRPWKVKSPQRA